MMMRSVNRQVKSQSAAPTSSEKLINLSEGAESSSKASAGKNPQLFKMKATKNILVV